MIKVLGATALNVVLQVRKCLRDLRRGITKAAKRPLATINFHYLGVLYENRNQLS